MTRLTLSVLLLLCLPALPARAQQVWPYFFAPAQGYQPTIQPPVVQPPSQAVNPYLPAMPEAPLLQQRPPSPATPPASVKKQPPAPSPTPPAAKEAPPGPTLSDLGKSLRNTFSEEEIDLLFQYMKDSVVASFKDEEVVLPPELAFKLEVVLARLKRESAVYMDRLIRQLEEDLKRSLKEKLTPPPEPAAPSGVRTQAY